MRGARGATQLIIPADAAVFKFADQQASACHCYQTVRKGVCLQDAAHPQTADKAITTDDRYALMSTDPGVMRSSAKWLLNFA